MSPVRDRADLRQPPFYVLVIIAGYLTYLVLGPFLVSLTWAAVFAVLFHDVYKGLAHNAGPNRAALIMTLLIGSLIVAPGVFLLSVVAGEAPKVANYLQQASLTEPRQLEQLWAMIRNRSPIVLPDEPTELLREGIQRGLAFLAPRAGAVVADVLATLGSLVAMLFALYSCSATETRSDGSCAICCRCRRTRPKSC
jgi:predicted PurR-regulated permease PerM